jgi:PAS domain S-box-containing protein
MEARRREVLRETPILTLAARVRAFSDQLLAHDASAAHSFDGDDAPTVRPPMAETLECLQLHREGLLVTDEALADDGPRTRPPAAVDGDGARRTLFDLAPDARLVTDERAVVAEINPAAAELLGVDAELARGRTLAAFIERDDHGRLRLGLSALAREGWLEIDLHLVGRAGVAVPVTLAAVRAADPGRFTWAVRVAAMKSGLRLASHPPSTLLVERLDALQQALDQRTIALEEALRERDELAEASRERDLALAVLAHELRGPMSAIVGWARLLRHPRAEAEQRARAVAVIEQNALQQKALVDALMDASRHSADKVTVVRERVDLGAVVAAAIEGARPDAAAVPVALTWQQRGPCVVFADARRLAQLVSNLVANALKFTPAGGAVAVRLTAADGVATLRVADTGVGIAPEHLSRIFERFHQGAHGRISGGLGLGLYLVREIAELHGGTVTAASPGEGLGATFTVTLPLAQ